MNLKVFIRDKFPDGYRVDSVATYQNIGGYGSVREMQTELLRRFPSQKNVRHRKLVNGLVRIDDRGQSRRITLTTIV